MKEGSEQINKNRLIGMSYTMALHHLTGVVGWGFTAEMTVNRLDYKVVMDYLSG
jgi:hypothetical protein